MRICVRAIASQRVSNEAALLRLPVVISPLLLVSLRECINALVLSCTHVRRSGWLDREEPLVVLARYKTGADDRRQAAARAVRAKSSGLRASQPPSTEDALRTRSRRACARVRLYGVLEAKPKPRASHSARNRSCQMRLAAAWGSHLRRTKMGTPSEAMLCHPLANS